MKKILLTVLLIARAFKQAARTPRTMRIARTNLIMWGIVSLVGGAAILIDVVGNGHWAFYLWNGPIFLMDVAMLRYSIQGYVWRKILDEDEQRAADEIRELERKFAES